MIIVIINCSYFIGMSWLILTKLEYHIIHMDDGPFDGEPVSDEDLFITAFGVD